MIHIIFDESATGSIRFALKKEVAEIIAFLEYLGEGPIQEQLPKETAFIVNFLLIISLQTFSSRASLIG